MCADFGFSRMQLLYICHIQFVLRFAYFPTLAPFASFHLSRRKIKSIASFFGEQSNLTVLARNHFATFVLNLRILCFSLEGIESSVELLRENHICFLQTTLTWIGLDRCAALTQRDSWLSILRKAILFTLVSRTEIATEAAKTSKMDPTLASCSQAKPCEHYSLVLD